MIVHPNEGMRMAVAPNPRVPKESAAPTADSVGAIPR